MAAADYAEDVTQEPPPELSLAFSCQRWNCLPYSGGYLDQPAGLMKRLNMSLNTLRAIQNRNQSKNWAEWARNNPEEKALIDYVEQLRQRHG